MRFRPPRTHKTQCLYIYGPTGLGKTTTIDRCLTSLQTTYGIDYYKKLRGLSKFWDSYDNEQIVYIDDPVKANIKYSEDDVQGLKNILSTGPCIADIKFGSMNFDSKLVIIAANISPDYMAESMGVDNKEPMMTDSCGSCYVDTKKKARKELPEVIFKCILSIHKILPLCDKPLDYDLFLANMPPVVDINY